MRPKVKKLLLVIVAGRPLPVEQVLPKADGLVMAWLPGSEGGPVSDMLFGDTAFSGHLPLTWYKDAAVYRRADDNLKERQAGTLFPFGFGMRR